MIVDNRLLLDKKKINKVYKTINKKICYFKHINKLKFYLPSGDNQKYEVQLKLNNVFKR